jgi:hypothetical protein
MRGVWAVTVYALQLLPQFQIDSKPKISICRPCHLHVKKGGKWEDFTTSAFGCPTPSSISSCQMLTVKTNTVGHLSIYTWARESNKAEIWRYILTVGYHKKWPNLNEYLLAYTSMPFLIPILSFQFFLSTLLLIENKSIWCSQVQKVTGPIALLSVLPWVWFLLI